MAIDFKDVLNRLGVSEDREVGALEDVKQYLEEIIKAPIVLTLCWNGGTRLNSGSIFVRKWRGMLFLTGELLQPDGPFGTMSEVLKREEFSRVLPNPKISSEVVALRTLKTVGEKLLGETGSCVSINGAEYSLRERGLELRHPPAIDESEVTEPEYQESVDDKIRENDYAILNGISLSVGLGFALLIVLNFDSSRIQELDGVVLGRAAVVLISTPITSFAGAVILRMLSKIAVGSDIKYWAAYKTVLKVGFVTYLTGVVLNIGGVLGNVDPVLSGIVAVGFPVLLGLRMLSEELKTTDGQAVGIWGALKVMLFSIGIFLAIATVLGGISAYRASSLLQVGKEKDALQLFDASANVSDAASAEYVQVDRVSGRIRNAGEKAVSRVRIQVVFSNSQNEAIETVRLDLKSVNTSAPLLSGDARSWSASVNVERLPLGFKWQLWVVDVDYLK